ncbi:MAG: periplasmic heavy metal sensor [Balneolaceae bacterium]|nr:periplasmic heavy metal sensor [Balneolaceae bacterium]
MEYKTKYRWALTGFLVMLVLNIVVVAGIWILRPGGGPPFREGQSQFRVQRFIERELNLSEEQRNAFRELRKDHIRETRAYFRDIRQARGALFEALRNEESDVAVDSLTAVIGRKQQELEEALYDHFSELRNICNDEQKAKFDQIISRVMQRVDPLRQMERRNTN